MLKLCMPRGKSKVMQNKSFRRSTFFTYSLCGFNNIIVTDIGSQNFSGVREVQKNYNLANFIRNTPNKGSRVFNNFFNFLRGRLFEGVFIVKAD